MIYNDRNIRDKLVYEDYSILLNLFILTPTLQKTTKKIIFPCEEPIRTRFVASGFSSENHKVKILWNYTQTQDSKSKRKSI
jgi:hypothetical protein